MASNKSQSRRRIERQFSRRNDRKTLNTVDLPTIIDLEPETKTKSTNTDEESTNMRLNITRDLMIKYQEKMKKSKVIKNTKFLKMTTLKILCYFRKQKTLMPRLYCLVEESLHSSIFNIIRKIFLNNGRIITKLRID